MYVIDSFECDNNEVFHNYTVKEDLNRIFGYNYQTNVELIQVTNKKCYNNLVYLECDVFVKMFSKLWKQIESAVLLGKSITVSHLQQMRKEAVNILISFQDCLLLNQCNQHFSFIQEEFRKSVHMVQKSVYSLNSFDDNIFRKIVHARKEKTSCYYFFFHGYLEIQWHLLCLNFLIDKSKENLTRNLEDLMKKLLHISVISYEVNGDHSEKFGCSCLKKIWLKLQLFCEECDINFWEVFTPLLNMNEFIAIFILLNIASLQGINDKMECIGADCQRIVPNLTATELLLKSFLKKTFENEELLELLTNLDKLLNHWWRNHAKIDVYQILWDYFNKNVNTIVSTEGVFQTAETFVKFIDNITAEEAFSLKSAFDYFLHMLAKHLRTNRFHWPKIKGRIYSRLPLHKLNDFNECGLSHIITLFLSLNNSVDFEELTSKLLTILENVSENQKNSFLIWNTYFVLIVLHDRKKLAIDRLVEPLKGLVENASNNRNHYHFVKLYIEGLSFVFKVCSDDLTSKRSLLSNWIFKYMIHCKYNELIDLIDVLCTIVRKVQELDEWIQWENVFREHVLPPLKQVAIKEDAPLQVGELIYLICHRSRELSKECVIQFTDEIIVPKVTMQFLNFYLNENSDIRTLSREQEITIIQAWIRCTLTTNLNINLSQKVFKLKVISSYLNVRDCNSLSSFIKIINDSILPNSYNSSLREICEICFGSADKWIEKYISEKPDADIVLQIYTIFGLLFFYCSILLYHKTKSNCLLSRLINTLLLPTDLLKGKSPNNLILNAVKRTWHLYVQGLFQLNCESDHYIERLLKDLITRYLPYFPVETSPIFKCLNDEKLCVFIFEKICSVFLSPNYKSMEDSTSKAVKIIMITIQNSHQDVNVDLVIRKTLPSVFEVIMFRTHKTVALDLLKLIVTNQNKYIELHELIKNSIISVVEKHLAFNVNNTFQLLSVLAKLVPQDVVDVLSNIRKQVVAVEKMRGVGFDNTLRKNLDNIEQILNK